VDVGAKANGKLYPATINEAVALVGAMPLKPTMLIDSGRGLHAYWLFLDVLRLMTKEQRERVARISEGWGKMLIDKAAKQGYALDSTFDISRVFRPVGTFNHNYGDRRAVRLLHFWDERRYVLEDFAPWEITDPAAGIGGHDFGVIVIPRESVPENELGAAFNSLLADPQQDHFRQLWQRTRKIGDGTPSVYTFAIGCEMWRAGATAQQIVDAMVTWRNRHGGDIKSLRWHKQELQRIAQKSERKRIDCTANSPPDGIVIGDCNLRPSSVHRTDSGKIVVSVSIERDRQPIDILSLTSSNSGRSQAAKVIRIHVGDGQDVAIATAIAKLLVDADQRAKSGPAAGSQTVRQIIHDLVPDEFRFTHRTGRGLWSEARGCEVQRSDFLAYTPEKLVRVCYAGMDCPRTADGIVKELDLLRRIIGALQVEWATLCDILPMAEADADNLDEKSEAADRFRHAILKLWHTMITFDVTLAKPDTKEALRASKSSLAAKVQRLSKEGNVRPTAWREIQTGYAAYWRREVDNSEMSKIVLGMRLILATQLKLEIPGVLNPTNLRRLGTRYRIFADVSSDSYRLADGNRLVVLSDEVTREILWELSPELADSHVEVVSDSEGMR
jgi:hypothetical protein